jgi:hypothetical protein
VTVLREAGEIPWDRIIDGERPLIKYPHAPTVRDYMLDRLDEAAVNPWHPASPPLVLTESKNLAQALAAPLYRLVPVIGGPKGQTGEGWLRTVASGVLAEHSDRRVFYLGDLDRAGGDIERNARSVLERHLGRQLAWEWLALTEDQISDLGVEPIWRVDGRDRQGRWAWGGRARIIDGDHLVTHPGQLSPVPRGFSPARLNAVGARRPRSRGTQAEPACAT